MCTLSFVPANEDFLIAMNRDELHSRQTALPACILEIDSAEVVCPREPGGGTWIACNDNGTCLALLNWHVPVAGHPVEQPQTRGSLIPALITAPTAAKVSARIESLPLKAILPFRLMGVFRSRAEVCEWRWNGATVMRIDHPWSRRHWFSSSISDDRATEERLRTIESAVRRSSRLDETWLRSLHSSHSPAPGPFSVCVHRQDASTVSYTMVRCSDGAISMGYLEGRPCLRAGFDALFTIRTRNHRSKVACT
jgi:hypothetical protein